MPKYTKPRNFNPSQEDLKRVGRKVAENLSTDKVVVTGTEKITNKIQNKYEKQPRDF